MVMNIVSIQLYSIRNIKQIRRRQEMRKMIDCNFYIIMIINKC